VALVGPLSGMKPAEAGVYWSVPVQRSWGRQAECGKQTLELIVGYYTVDKQQRLQGGGQLLPRV